MYENGVEKGRYYSLNVPLRDGIDDQGEFSVTRAKMPEIVICACILNGLIFLKRILKVIPKASTDRLLSRVLNSFNSPGKKSVDRSCSIHQVV